MIAPLDLVGGTVLVITGDPEFVADVTGALAELRCKVAHAFTGEDGLRLYDAQRPDAVLVDLDVHGLPGIRVVDVLGSRAPSAVIAAGSSVVADAVEAMQLGASDFLAKPLDDVRLRSAVGRALAAAEIGRPDRPRGDDTTGTWLGVGAQMRELARQVELAGRCSSTTILLLGESGTGKGHVARKLHSVSARARRPFVEVKLRGPHLDVPRFGVFGHEKGAFTDAKEMKPGLFEVANHGTLFLDEIGDRAPELQPKLLKVLEKGRFRRVGGTREIEVDVP